MTRRDGLLADLLGRAMNHDELADASGLPPPRICSPRSRERSMPLASRAEDAVGRR
jgi:hypothetical protein